MAAGQSQRFYSGVGIFNWYYPSSPPQILRSPRPAGRVPLESWKTKSACATSSTHANVPRLWPCEERSQKPTGEQHTTEKFVDSTLTLQETSKYGKCSTQTEMSATNMLPSYVRFWLNNLQIACAKGAWANELN